MTAHRHPALVLKLGGSLAESGRMADVLEIVARARRPLVVVPGGGTFADTVRDAQRHEGFSDAAAHEMAILAMEQQARAIADAASWLRPAATLAEIRAALAVGRIALWLPARLAIADAAIPRDWSITSDGLAARLAERLGVAEVALVKSCRIPPDASPEALAEKGIVDPVLPVIAARAGIAVRVFGAGDDIRLASRLGASARRARERTTDRASRGS